MSNLSELQRRLYFVFPIVLISIIIVLSLGSCIDQPEGNNAKQQDEESLEITNSVFAITEAKSCFGGAWFNKDVVLLWSSFLVINKKSLFSGSESIIVPYKNVKKIEFITGENTHKIIITYDEGNFMMRGSAKFNLRNISSLDLAYSNIGERTKQQIPLVRKATLCKKINAVISYLFQKKEQK